jgi:hypothetical protein
VVAPQLAVGGCVQWGNDPKANIKLPTRGRMTRRSTGPLFIPKARLFSPRLVERPRVPKRRLPQDVLAATLAPSPAEAVYRGSLPRAGAGGIRVAWGLQRRCRSL